MAIFMHFFSSGCATWVHILSGAGCTPNTPFRVGSVREKLSDPAPTSETDFMKIPRKKNPCISPGNKTGGVPLKGSSPDQHWKDHGVIDHTQYFHRDSLRHFKIDHNFCAQPVAKYKSVIFEFSTRTKWESNLSKISKNLKLGSQASRFNVGLERILLRDELSKNLMNFSKTFEKKVFSRGGAHLAEISAKKFFFKNFNGIFQP